MTVQTPSAGETSEGEARAPAWPDAASRARAAAFMDLWERQVSERARLGPDGCAREEPDGPAGRRETPAPAGGVEAPGDAPPPDRRGAPAPLILHLASAAELFEAGARLAPLAAAEGFPWSAPRDSDRALAAEIAAAPPLETAMALRLEGAERLAAMMRGLRRYQASPVRRSQPDPPTVWRRGSTRLLDFGAVPDGAPGARAVLVTPSLINRHHILDLDENASLIRYLKDRGLRPLLLDWGEPGAAERGFDVSAYIAHRLAPALDAALEISGERSIALMGYCMGGAMTAALAALRPDAVSRMALIGAPWDFSGMTPMRGALAALGVTGDRAALKGMIDAVEPTFGAVPVTALEAVFAQLDPGLTARKFRRFAAMDLTSPEARRFVLIEDWLNAGPPLAGPAARETLIDWHLDNLPGRGLWRIDGARVDIGAIRAPTLVVAGAKDRIAPPAATEPAAAIPGARVLRPDAGHVGMIVGRGAVETLWRPLAAFLCSET